MPANYIKILGRCEGQQQLLSVVNRNFEQSRTEMSNKMSNKMSIKMSSKNVEQNVEQKCGTKMSNNKSNNGQRTKESEVKQLVAGG